METLASAALGGLPIYFNPLRPRGTETQTAGALHHAVPISTHSVRAGGDAASMYITPNYAISTHSARGGGDLASAPSLYAIQQRLHIGFIINDVHLCMTVWAERGGVIETVLAAAGEPDDVMGLKIGLAAPI